MIPDVIDDLKKCLKEFDERCEAQPGPISNSWCFGSGRTVFVTFAIHGDEVGSFPSVLKLIDQVLNSQISFSHRLIVALGNRPALEAGTRFVKSDLNRCFDKIDNPSHPEEQRAAELAQVIGESDLYLDLHQTIEPSVDPFFIFAFHRKSYDWARYVASPSTLVTHSMEECFSQAGLCSDEYAQLKDVATLSVEFYQKGFSKVASDACDKFLKSALLEFEYPKRVNHDMRLLKVVHRELLKDGGDRLLPGLKNLMPIEEGRPLGSRGDGSPLLAPTGGYLLFPKYVHSQKQAYETIADALFAVAKEVELSSL